MNKLTEHTEIFPFNGSRFRALEASSDVLREETLFSEHPYGTSHMRHWLFDGIQITHSMTRYHDHYTFEKENVDDVVNLSFNLKGRVLISHLDAEYAVDSRQHNMIYSPSFSNTFRNLDEELETFSIQFAPAAFLKMIENSNGLLDDFAAKIRQGQPAVLARDSLTLAPGLETIIGEIRHCQYGDGLKKIFLLSKSIELLVLQTDAYVKSTRTQDYQIKTSADKERIRYAGRYLLDHLENPPSLSALARIAAINEYKLKRGFKEIFHHTVFGYLSAHRLQLARRMLLDTGKTAAQISYELGYASPQHFSRAYKKQFGITPNGERKHKK